MERSPFLAVTVAVCLGGAPAFPRVASASPPAPEATDPAAVVREIQAAEARANEEPEEGLPALEALLDDVAGRGVGVAGAPEVRKARILAYLTLARGHLALGQRQAAEQAMQEAIRLAAPEEPPAEIFGPTLTEFYKKRRAYLEAQGTGGIRVHCGVPCVVYVDERHVPDGEAEGLFMGPHRLHVRPAAEVTGGDPPPKDSILDMTVLLDADHREVVVPYAPPGLAPPEARDEAASPSRPKGRLLPVWAEGLGIGLGVAGVGVGATLLALDGRCAGDDKNPQTCPDLYEFTAAGSVTVALSAAVLVTGVVLLAVDAARAKKRRGGRRVAVSPAGLRVSF